MLKNADFFFSIHNIDGIYKFACNDVSTVTGYTSSELVGRSAYEFFHTNDLRDIVKSHLNLKTHIQEVTYRIRRKDDKYVWVRTFSHGTREEIYCFTYRLSFMKILFYKLLNLKIM